MDCSPPGSSVHEDSPGKNTGAGCHTLLQGIFPSQGSNPGLLHCRQILYLLNYQGSPYIYTCPLFFGFPSHLGHHRALTRVPCAIQKVLISSVHLLSRVLIFATPWTAACQASLSITNSRSSPKLMCIKLVMLSHPLSSPSPPAPNPSQHQSLFQ